MWRIIAAAAAFLLVGTGAAHAEWRRAESPNFVLVGDLPENALRERILLLEDLDRLLRILTAGEEEPARNKLHVYIVDGIGELRAIRPTLPPNAAGFYAASEHGLIAAVDGGDPDAGNQFLFHEYAHHFMMQNSTVRYPAWFVEGSAEFLATVRFSARKIDIGRLPEGRIFSLQGEWLPMERLLSAGPFGLNGDDMGAYYAQSWLLTHYFFSNAERQAALGRLLAAVQQGRTGPEALQSATGLTPAALARELRAYIGGRISYRQMDRGTAAPPAVTVTMLPRSARDLILYEAAVRSGVSDEQGPAYLQRIRTAAARYPDDPLAMRVLARIELHFGDRTVADSLLDRLLAGSPNDAELLYFKGMRWLLAAQGENPPERAGANARQWFGRAQRADQDHWQTLYQYAESLRGEAAFTSDNTRNALLLAHRLAPQVQSITLSAASLLITRREYVYAIALLRPLVGDPHNSRLAGTAREMTDRAEAEMRAAPAGAPAAGGTGPGN